MTCKPTDLSILPLEYLLSISQTVKRLISFPNCKINLGLNVIRKRQDGFHDIETVFYPLQLHDVLEIIKLDPSRAIEPVTKLTTTKFITTGLPINGATEKNLCIKAYQRLQQDISGLPPVHIYLHKAIPIGAGLGGGSADGSFTLKLLNEKFQLKLTKEQLLDYALGLGSDCPFFILNRPCFATGRGDFLEAIDLDLSAYSFMIVHPGVHINTAWAFEQLTPAVPVKPIRDIIFQPVSTWRNELTNDFEQAVCDHHPELSSIKSKLYNAGAIYASLSGSGSCFYGIFPKNHFPELGFTGSFQVLLVK
ncbi:MAG: 4-(cytidine 5'-diphospho)-2-C-methyl-D-erythritol kinase [Flavitalea sp.]